MTAEQAALVGRLVRTERHRSLTFLWCWSPPRLVQCVAGADVTVRTGAVVRIRGRWQPYRGRLAACHAEELLASSVEVLAVPEYQHRAHELAGLPGAAAHHGRCLAIDAGQAHLDELGHVRLPTPLLVGAAATVGATSPFRVRRGGTDVGYLPVSNLVAAQHAVAAGLERVQILSSLFWQHRSSDRSNLAELNLLELASAGTSLDGVLTTVEGVLESIRAELAARIGSLVPGNRLGTPLAGLPVLTHAELERMVAATGTDVRARHVVPRAAVNHACRELGASGFWLTGPPAATTPYYVRSAGSASVAAELLLDGVGEVASGSEWVTDAQEARAATAELPVATVRERYLQAVAALPVGTAGFSVGVDRLLMHLLAVPRAAELVPDARTSRSFRSARPTPPPVSPAPIPSAEVTEPAVDPVALRVGGARAARTAAWLRERGFARCVTSLLDEPWHRVLGTGLPSVDYFGRDVPLVAVRAPLLHRLLASCPAPFFQAGPVATGEQPVEVLDLAVPGPTTGELVALAESVLAATGLDPARLERRPRAPGRPGYLRGSLDGRGLDGVEWRLAGALVATAGSWVRCCTDVPGALGTAATEQEFAPLRGFLASAPPPAGGVTIFPVDHLPRT